MPTLDPPIEPNLENSTQKVIANKSLDQALNQARNWLAARQEKDGSWIGEVILNPGPTAQTVMLYQAIGRSFPEELAPKAKAYILREQNEDGGWSPFAGAESEVSLSCECYTALRLLGEPADSEICQKALQKIKSLGGLYAANPWTQLYHAILGVLPWEDIYRTPIEVLLIPKSLPIHISHFSYWVKAITIPMALLGSVGPGEPIALAATLRNEMLIPGEVSQFKNHWTNKILFPLGRGLAKFTPQLKKKCIREALDWIEGFTEKHGDFGGNTCTAMNVLMSYHRLGMDKDEHFGQVFEKGLEAMLSYAFEDESEWRMQCCQSHVWDTGFALASLDPNMPSDMKEKGLQWLKDRQILDTYGEWSKKVEVAPGGWCFGNRHDHYPVTDCTAVSLLALGKNDPSYKNSSEAKRAIDWLVALQHKGGGWSAYEKYTTGDWLNRFFKFKDIDDALVDVPKADVSSKVLEALSLWRKEYPELEDTLQKGRKFLLSKRDKNGLWTGNYGVNYIYGTAFSAKALRSIDGKTSDDWTPEVRSFFQTTQNSDGGWGECETSYQRKKYVTHTSSPVQSAWSLIALCACFSGDESEKEYLRKGRDYLLQTQQDNGIWNEEIYLGTVFPNTVYFRYELYEAYFPIMALLEVEKLERGHLL